MNCSNCGHLNDGGKFCVNCGTKLGEEVAVKQTAATSEAQSQSQVQPQPNQHVVQAKQVSKSYFSYFAEGLKNPTSTAQEARDNQFINALITVILYVISVPLMLYFGWKLLLIQFIKGMADLAGAEDMLDPSDIAEFKAADTSDIINMSFTDIVIKQSIFFFIGLIVIIGAAYLAAKLGKIDVPFKQFFSRFGTFLIIPTALLLVGFVLSLIHMEFFSYFMAFGLLSLLFVIPLTIASFKPSEAGGLDRIYGTLAVYVVAIIVFRLISKGLVEEAKVIISQAASSAFGSIF
ncbi:zinc ribbon domain-containing protein [Priestia megaterium]|uniref:zinc ribbon domain-containing protein n=1 Tax=Priestia megaterium TaxID=1404 RepID=UPI001C24993B|nr:zinc ribbon domain-containing protein [Priestia megaterium]MBU8686485.1 zinc ribbon domain-containing protein [Priestia megaterium]